MDFLIADTFTDSLTRLTGEEQKAVKTTAFDLQVNPAQPSLHFHKLDRARDKDFWSVRVGADLRLIVHRTADSLLLCYVDHHDSAYRWAERRKLDIHPKTGAAQLVEIRERVEEIVVPKYIEVERPAKPRQALFENLTDAELLSYGVPPEWVADVRRADEDVLLELTDHLPAEAAEALLELATGGKPRVSPWLFPPPGAFVSARMMARSLALVVGGKWDVFPQTNSPPNPFQHPDALRRFRLIDSAEELARALDYPWEKWTIFLHPAQRQWVETDFNGPARVSGSAGTGKTIVALHRAVYSARQHPDSRVLLTTFSDVLAKALRIKLKRLISNEPRLAERLEVHAVDSIGLRLYEAQFSKAKLVQPEDLANIVNAASQTIGGHRFGASFLINEWTQVIDAWQLTDWEAYRDFKRLGRKVRLPEAQREQLWRLFECIRATLAGRGMLTRAAMFTALAGRLAAAAKRPFDYVVVDEAQILDVPQLRFLAALGGQQPDGLFFTGDLGQRIFQQAFSWKALGIDIRGRSRTLHVNYRTSHQIRSRADKLLDPEISDVDGNTESRRGTVSVFNGPAPTLLAAGCHEAEIDAVGQWIKSLIEQGLQPNEIGVFVRSPNELDRAQAAVHRAGGTATVLDEHLEPRHGFIAVGTMHLAKGLEFRAVAVMACDDEVIPSQERIESVAEESDLQEVYDTERHLLYVACTRARDYLMVSSGDVPSEFLEDLAT